MEIVNTTPYLAQCTISTDKNGQDHLLAILKATFTIPKDGGNPELITENNIPIIDADIYTGDPERSAVLFESDFAFYKPHCDVLLNGAAYAPEGKPATQVHVGIKIAKVRKVITVNGDRVWRYFTTGIQISDPKPFIKKTISYNIAFGGIDDFDEDQTKHTAYLHNPAGLGYHKVIKHEYIENMPAPNLEEFDKPVQSPLEKYRPVSFGPIGRAWPIRAKLAGSYDATWEKTQFPFLPKDFDERYFQSAPEDQQTDYLKGGESVYLLNLTPEGKLQFKIPTMQQRKVVYYFFNGDYKIKDFHIDTLHLLPEDGIFTLTARASIPLYGDPLSCSKVIIGRGTRGWQRALEHGKRYVPTI